MFELPYKNIKSNKESEENFNFLSDNIVWNDLNLPGYTLGKGASAPDLVQFLAAGSINAYAFDGTVTAEQLYGSFELLHGWKQGTNIEVHLHWSPTTTNTGNVKWQLEYTWQNLDGTFGASTTIAVTTAAGGTAWSHNISKFADISGSGLRIGSAFVFRLFRDPTDASDTYAFDAALINVGIHYQIDTIGSKERYLK